MIQTDRNQQLQNALNFTTEDLMMNRNGTLTESQQSRLKQTQGCQRISTMLSLVMVIVIFGGIAAFYAFLMPNREEFTAMLSQSPEAGPLVIAVMVVVLLLIGGSFLRTLGRTRRLNRGEISSVTGNAKVKRLHSKYGDSGRIKIGREKFLVTEDVLNGFEQDGVYCVYYIKNPPMHHILSAEAMEI
ncbi:MAG: hypothetical protein H6672_10665 [Anaerolineaceae bacterium]|nr:hypothetical protein [Anaerolineaceae bacterium]